MKVWEVMHRALVTVSPDSPVRVAEDLMRDHRVRHLLVTDPEEGHLIGILTDRDVWHSVLLPMLAQHLAWEERWLKAPRVRDIMTSKVVTIEPDADLVRAGLLMFERRIGSLPVTDRGRLVGILTERDLLKAFGTDPGSSPAEVYLG